MNAKRYDYIKSNAARRKERAESILEGDADNYDGADGARYILELAEHVEELIAALEGAKQ